MLNNPSSTIRRRSLRIFFVVCRRIPTLGQCSLKPSHGIGVWLPTAGSASCDDQRQCVRSAGLFGATLRPKNNNSPGSGGTSWSSLWIRWMRPRVDVVAFTSTDRPGPLEIVPTGERPAPTIYCLSRLLLLGTIQTDRNQSSANNPSCSPARESGGAVPPKSGAIWPAPALRTPDRSHSRTPAARSLQKRLHKMSRIRARKRNCQP